MSSRSVPKSVAPPSARKAAKTAWEAALAGPAADPLRRAMWLEAVDQQLRPALPPALAAHARLANVDGTTLVYLVDGPVWHSRLRLAGESVLAAARSVGLGVTSMAVRTARQPFPEPPGSRSRPGAPTPAAEHAALRAARHLLADHVPTPPVPGRRRRAEPSRGAHAKGPPDDDC